MHFVTHRQSYFIIYFFFLFTISGHSIIFVNFWHSCVDVSVEGNIFPVSLIQSTEYYQVCAASREHWRRFGSSLFRMHIVRTSEPLIDKYVDIHHNGYVHFHNETRTTVVRRYGTEHEDL